MQLMNHLKKTRWQKRKSSIRIACWLNLCRSSRCIQQLKFFSLCSQSSSIYIQCTHSCSRRHVQRTSYLPLTFLHAFSVAGNKVSACHRIKPSSPFNTMHREFVVLPCHYLVMKSLYLLVFLGINVLETFAVITQPAPVMAMVRWMAV